VEAYVPCADQGEDGFAVDSGSVAGIVLVRQELAGLVLGWAAAVVDDPVR
jgi:hypothetical protein